MRHSVTTVMMCLSKPWEILYAAADWTENSGVSNDIIHHLNACTHTCIMIKSDNSIPQLQLTHLSTQRTLLRIRLYFHDWVSGAEASDDQLEPFQLQGLITSHVPPQHLVAHSAPALLRHKLIDAQYDGDPLSIALSHNAPQLWSKNVPGASLLRLNLCVQNLRSEITVWNFSHAIKHKGRCCLDISDEIISLRLTCVFENA